MVTTYLSKIKGYFLRKIVITIPSEMGVSAFTTTLCTDTFIPHYYKNSDGIDFNNYRNIPDKVKDMLRKEYGDDIFTYRRRLADVSPITERFDNTNYINSYTSLTYEEYLTLRNPSINTNYFINDNVTTNTSSDFYNSNRVTGINSCIGRSIL